MIKQKDALGREHKWKYTRAGISARNDDHRTKRLYDRREIQLAWLANERNARLRNIDRGTTTSEYNGSDS